MSNLTRLLASGVALGLATMSATPATAAVTYAPVGTQTNVALSTVTNGGWTQCLASSMGTFFGSSAATTLAGCTGDLLLVAGRVEGSSTLLALAYATKADVLFDTGAANNGVFHNANGTDWFNADNWSIGFKTQGSAYTKFQCGIAAAGAAGMCIHTVNNAPGYSINQTTTYGGYERLFFTANSTVPGVPEPATWAMMLIGFGAMGFAMRRRSAVTARVRFA